MRYVDR